MGRKFDLTKPLSEHDLEFLKARDRWAEIRQNAENLGLGEDEVVNPPDPDEGEPEIRSARQGDRTEHIQTPDQANPAQASLGQRQRMAAEEFLEVTQETEERPYEDWLRPELKEEAQKRGLPMSGNKQAVVDRLRGWDEAHPDAKAQYEAQVQAEPETGDKYDDMDYDELAAEASDREVEYEEADDSDTEAENIREALRADDEGQE